VASDITSLQQAAGPTSDGLAQATSLLLPPSATMQRLGHFPEEVYDLSAESHLVRFLKVLLGDAGAGQLRKRILASRLSQSMQGVHFYDLDRFYGSIFQVRRNADEALDVNPYVDTATSQTWSVQQAKDASYASRVSQFAKALAFGPTPTGIELIAEALLTVDCDVFESFVQADGSYQTIAEIEALYGPSAAGTIGDMESLTLGQLEGEGLARMSGNDRRVFVVRPKRPITQAEAYEVGRVLRTIKPADARFVIDPTGSDAYREVALQGAYSDSTFWEVVPFVVPNQGTTSPYPVSSTTAVEQPVPPLSSYQGEAWSYLGDVIGIATVTRGQDDALVALPVQRVTLSDGTFVDYPPFQALTPRRYVLAGRVASDGIAIAHPLWGSSQANTSSDLAPLTIDRMPLDALSVALTSSGMDSLPQNPAERYWVSPERPPLDTTPEIVVVSLAHARLLNHLSVEVAHYPHKILVEAFLDGVWVTVGRSTVTDSVPQYLSHVPSSVGHPQHSFSGHWLKQSFSFPAIETISVRLTFSRTEGTTPTTGGARVNYSLAVRSLDLGFRVLAVSDVSQDLRGGQAIGRTLDVLGSVVEYRLRQESAADMLSGAQPVWRSEPQPVNYAVVNFFLDVRDETGDAQVIDRVFLHPTHTGAHMTVYWTQDVGEPGEDWYAERVWQPIPRDYTLQKGYVYLPPTRARHLKFEFTALSAEPVETFLPIVHTVRLFPPHLVDSLAGNTAGGEVLTNGLGSALAIGDAGRYSDVLALLSNQVAPVSDAAAALYVTDPRAAEALRSQSWLYGFTPWHQGGPAPRFTQAQVHDYQIVEMTQSTKVGFMVGLFDVKAFRADFAADDDPGVYTETFDDFRHITPGFTWTMDPGKITTGLISVPVSVTSSVYSSAHDVQAVQFATQQTEPVQVLPDDDFRDPALAISTWDGTDAWHKTGDAYAVYSPGNHSVRVARYAQPLPQQGADARGLVRPLPTPTFSSRSFSLLGGWPGLRVNQATNPSFETNNGSGGVAGVTGGVISTTWAKVGTHSLYVASGSATVVVAGPSVSIVARSIGQQATLGATTLTSVTANQTLTFTGAGTLSMATGYWDCLLDGAPGSWFDGNSVDSSGYNNTYAWDGTANASTSRLLPGQPWGGVESPLVGVSPVHGFVYVAVRMTYLTGPVSPVWLQVLDGSTRAVLGEYPVTGPAGSVLEVWHAFPSNGGASVYVRAIQKGASDDVFEIDRLSLFDAGISWEFSVNGGTDWVLGDPARNNPRGVVTFPSPGNQLVWRATGYRSFLAINSLRIRPQYIGVVQVRDDAQRGPNVSPYDEAVPVPLDPMFTVWHDPVPRDWFSAYRQFPSLVLTEGPNSNEFSRFYSRPTAESVTSPSDVASRIIILGRTTADLAWSTGNPTVLDGMVRVSLLRRTTPDSTSVSDNAYALVLPPRGDAILANPAHPAAG